MAFDTKAKRLAMIGFLMPFVGQVSEPTGTIDQAARQDFLWFDRNTLAGEIVLSIERIVGNSLITEKVIGESLVTEKIIGNSLVTEKVIGDSKMENQGV